MQVLVFIIAGVRYAIALEAVKEIVRAAAVTPLPNVPPAVDGVLGYRGTAVPVFNMRFRFGAPARELEPAERFVIARTYRRTVALRVDSVDWIHDLATGEIQDLTELTAGSPYITGVTRITDELLFIHDLETFLSAAEAQDLEASLTEWNVEHGR